MVRTVHSIKSIEKCYPTGEEPLLVLCSDMNEYICKYPRTGGAAYKMASELVGVLLAQTWKLKTPVPAFVKISPSHWTRAGKGGVLALGSKRMTSVIDINPITEGGIPSLPKIAKELLRIALFDFWVANEDRNANNANLMFDVSQNTLVSIDYGCIFNTAMYDYPMSQLTSTDTILASGVFEQLKTGMKKQSLPIISRYYTQCIHRSQQAVTDILNVIPTQWNIPQSIITGKLNQLFDTKWMNDTWDNFKVCFMENLAK